MKILKIFGIVVGIHVFALILIFANPGCSSTTKPAPSSADTVAATDSAPSAAPMITVPPAGGGGADQLAGTPVTPAAGSDVTASAGTEATSGVRFSPTRPNTPAASAVLRGDVENVTPATTYAVKKGDSLWSVAHKFHISTKELTAANNLRSNAAIRPGQKLIIPSNAPAGSKAATAKGTAAAGAAAVTKAAASPSTRPTSQEFKYKVKPGETLGGIAHKFGVPVAELGAQNNISDPMKLRAGTELTIPGWQPTSGGSNAAKGTASHERRSRERTERGSQPAATPAPAAPETAPAPATTQPEQQTQVPNLLEPSPAQPAPSDSTPSTSVPVINIDDNAAPSSTSTPSQ